LDYGDEVKIGNISFRVIDEKSARDKDFLISPMAPKTMIIDRKSIQKDEFEKPDKD